MKERNYFGFFVRTIVNRVMPSIGRVIVFDDRENLCYSLESEQAGLGKLFNQSNRDFEKYIKEIFNRKNVEHLIFGCVGTLEKFSLNRNIINRPLESVSCKKNAADNIIDISTFIEIFRVKPIARIANHDDYIKQKSLELLALHADQTGKINLAFAGTMLNQELGLKNLKWSGYGSCKKYILNLNTNFRVKDDLLFINVLH